MFDVFPMALPRPQTAPETEAEMFERLVRSRRKWGRRRKALGLKARVLGRRKTSRAFPRTALPIHRAVRR